MPSPVVPYLSSHGVLLELDNSQEMLDKNTTKITLAVYAIESSAYGIERNQSDIGESIFW